MKLNNYSNLISFFIGILFFMGSDGVALAQYKDGKIGNGILPSITPLSPEASSLGKYGNWPVSYYTGTVGISIPIYQIKTSGFELPIQLSYHTGGVKVDEVPSLCGTGWTLNAGGAITRTIIGLPDEEYQGFYTRNKRNEFIKTVYNLNTPQGYAELRKIADRQIDTEPDMFFFNFAGNSGKFYFDNEGNFQCIPVNCLKLVSSPITNNLTSHWEIVDQQGNHFFFGTDGQGIENTTIKNINPGPPIEVQEPNAWYLTKIVLNNNADTIFFDYVDKAERYVQSPVYSYKIAPEGVGSVSGLLGSGVSKLTVNQVLRNGSYDVSNDQTAIIIGGKTSLSKIRWSLGEIKFDANMSRQDIAFGKNLTKITVLNKQLEKLKETLFSYTYTGGRYYLDSLTEFGANGVRNYAHNFEYYNRDQLALRNSNAQDHWGYYNGANGNTHLLPPNPIFNTLALNADREPNENFMTAGALKRIIYPTGGVTEYEYEANRYIAQNIPGGGNPSGQIISAGKTVNATDPQTTAFQRIESFNIPFDQNLITVNLKFRNYGKPPRKTAGLLPIVKLQKLVNQSYQDVYSWDAFDNFPTSNPVQNQNYLYDYDVDKSISLTTGDYRIVADILPISFGEEEPPVIKPSVMAIVNYQKYSEGGGIANPTEPIAGGLRIKQISNYANGTLASKKQFTYAGGNLLLYPKYVHEYAENVWPLSDCVNNPQENCNIICLEVFLKYKETISSGQTILGFTQGSPVGYTSIVEKEINPNNETNGYTQYSYSYEADNLNEFQFDFSYWHDTEILNSSVPTNNNELKRGLLLEKKTFKRNNGGTFVEVSSTENIYDFNIGNVANRYNTIRGMRVKKMRTVDYSCGTSETGYILPSTGYAPDFGYAFYDIYTSWIQSKSTIEKNYDTNGLNPIVTRTDFSYNNPYHLQPTTITKKNSDDLINEKQLIYPHEMVTSGRDPNGIYQGMIAKNMITNVIEQKETVNGKFSLQRTNYIEPILGLHVPGTIEYRNTSTGNDEVRLRYLNYSNNGNIQSLSLDFGAKISYLYSYNSQYPIAEIKNADYATIESILGGSAAVSSFAASNPTDAAVNTLINTLRNSALLKDAQITSYTYKPLVGLTSSTDAKGMTTYYEYDAFQRLKTIKDQDGNILKQTDYHYKN